MLHNIAESQDAPAQLSRQSEVLVSTKAEDAILTLESMTTAENLVFEANVDWDFAFSAPEVSTLSASSGSTQPEPIPVPRPRPVPEAAASEPDLGNISQ